MSIKTALFRAIGVFAVALMVGGVSRSYGGDVTDPRDKQKYRTVKIGGDTWMAENLNYKAGESWCYSDDGANCKKYGRLYDWNAAKSACPKGWHLPDTVEWNRLMVAASGVRKAGSGHQYYNHAGRALKSTGGWSDSGNGANDYGFSAKPGGYRYYFDAFYGAGSSGGWWSASDSGSGHAYYRYMNYGLDSVYEYYGVKSYGFSVRCVLDNTY